MLLTYLVNVSILYSLKTPENLWFPGIFEEYKMETLSRDALMKIVTFPMNVS